MHRIILENFMWLNEGRRIQGENEENIFENFVRDFGREQLDELVTNIFRECSPKTKDNQKSSSKKEFGNTKFKNKLFSEARLDYSKSLRYAILDSEEYAVVLGNRSAALFNELEYEQCLKDIHLCLNANCPDKLKAKILIRQAKCLGKMGDSKNMRKCLIDLLDSIDNDEFGLSSDDYDYYRDIISKEVVSKVQKAKKDPCVLDQIPKIEGNPNFLGASNAVSVRYNQLKTPSIVAKSNIDVGDVLFVEKAYAFTPSTQKETCQFCLIQEASLIPCDHCVKHAYCSSTCKQKAWKQFHQWECFGIQHKFFEFINDALYAAFRIALKAAFEGFPSCTVNKKKWGNGENNFPYVVADSVKLNEVGALFLMETIMQVVIIVWYLKLKTNFFQELKNEVAQCNEMSEDELVVKVGGLMIKCTFISYYKVQYDFDTFDEKSTKRGITMAFSAFKSINHSCIANSVQYTIGDYLILKAVKPIKKDEEVLIQKLPIDLINYVPNLHLSILKNADIKCNCDFCTKPSNLHPYCCIKCNGRAVAQSEITLIKKVCTICKHEFNLSPDTLIQEHIVWDTLIKFISCANVSDANAILQIASTIYKPNHMIFGIIYKGLLKYYAKKKDIKLLLATADKYIYHTSSFYPNLIITLDIYNTLLACIETLKEIGPTMSKDKFHDAIRDTRTYMEKLKEILALNHPQLIPLMPSAGKRLSVVEERFN